MCQSDKYDDMTQLSRVIIETNQILKEHIYNILRTSKRPAQSLNKTIHTQNYLCLNNNNRPLINISHF